MTYPTVRRLIAAFGPKAHTNFCQVWEIAYSRTEIERYTIFGWERSSDGGTSWQPFSPDQPPNTVPRTPRLFEMEEYQ